MEVVSMNIYHWSECLSLAKDHNGNIIVVANDLDEAKQIAYQKAEELELRCDKRPDPLDQDLGRDPEVLDAPGCKFIIGNR
jgi:hypothetical protein